MRIQIARIPNPPAASPVIIPISSARNECWNGNEKNIIFTPVLNVVDKYKAEDYSSILF